MAKEINNVLVDDQNLDDMMRQVTGQVPAPRRNPVPARTGKKKQDDTPYRHCSFICTPELWDKAQAIARRENFSIRQVMEHWMRLGIESYEVKNGKVKIKAERSLEDAL
jgi:hypothetical protein